MKPAPRWTTEQLTTEASRAREIFREERLREPLEKWKEIFEQKADEFRELLDIHGAAGFTMDAQATKLVRDGIIWTHLAADAVQRMKVVRRLAKTK